MNPLFRILRPLSVIALLWLTACPQMTTSAVGTPGGPLNANGASSDASKSEGEKTLDGPADEATPLPSSVGGLPSGGGDPAGTTPPPDMTLRSREGTGGVGDAMPVSNPISGPVSGPIASRDGGILSAPASRETIDNPDDNLRIVYFPAGAPRRWTNSSEFLRGVTDTQAAKAKVRHLSFVICPPCTPDPEFPYVVRHENEVPGGGMVTEPGYYLFFTIRDELIADGFLLMDLGSGSPDEWSSVTSLEHLKSLVEDDRLKFLGDRTILPLIMIDRDDLLPVLPRTRQPLVPLNLR